MRLRYVSLPPGSRLELRVVCGGPELLPRAHTRASAQKRTAQSTNNWGRIGAGLHGSRGDRTGREATVITVSGWRMGPSGEGKYPLVRQWRNSKTVGATNCRRRRTGKAQLLRKAAIGDQFGDQHGGTGRYDWGRRVTATARFTIGAGPDRTSGDQPTPILGAS